VDYPAPENCDCKSGGKFWDSYTETGISFLWEKRKGKKEGKKGREKKLTNLSMSSERQNICSLTGNRTPVSRGLAIG
jgi:hypothetical protein